MDLVSVVLILIAVGVLIGLLNKYGPAYIDAWYVQLINVVVIIAVVIWLLGLFGLWGALRSIKVGRD
jgi:hypothetical protein